MVFGCPSEPFTEQEITDLRQYLADGGSVALFLSEGGEEKLGTNLNALLAEYGISVGTDAVVRTVFYKCVTTAAPTARCCCCCCCCFCITATTPPWLLLLPLLLLSQLRPPRCYDDDYPLLNSPTRRAAQVPPP